LTEPQKEAYLIDVAVPNTHKLYSTTTEKLQKYRSERKANKDMATERCVFSAIGIVNNGTIKKKKHCAES
jgi:hypothetical protein